MLFRQAAPAALALALVLTFSASAARASHDSSDSGKDAATYLNSGSDKYAKGDLDGAISDYDHAIKLNPKLAKAYYSRGLARYDKGSLQEAIADYDQAIKLNPSYENAYVNRALAKDDNNDHDGAIADENEALKLDPRDPYAYNNRGWAYYRKGQSGCRHRGLQPRHQSRPQARPALQRPRRRRAGKGQSSPRPSPITPARSP